MKKTILLVILDQYADWEAAYLSPWINALGQDRYTVRTVSLDRNPVRSLGGFTVLPDDDITSAPADFEACILIGGMSWRTEAARQVISLVQAALDHGKILAGICDASAFLGTIGVLNSVFHTSNDVNDLKQWAGDRYTGEQKYLMQPVVRDNNIITANGTASIEFAREVLLALQIAPEDKIEAWYAFYKRGVYDAPMPAL